MNNVTKENDLNTQISNNKPNYKAEIIEILRNSYHNKN